MAKGNKEQENDCGGEEDDWREYILPDSQRGCDKANHFLRSLFNQPNHAKKINVFKSNIKQKNLDGNA